MKISFFIFFFSFIIILLLISMVIFSFSYHFLEESKSSPFECGFSSIGSVGLTFSLPFFVISVMFLLFDVEIIIICFYPFFCLKSLLVEIMTFFIIFLVLFSTLYEWLKGILSWF